jgi:hypothetical protein
MSVDKICKDIFKQYSKCSMLADTFNIPNQPYHFLILAPPPNFFRAKAKQNSVGSGKL